MPEAGRSILRLSRVRGDHGQDRPVGEPDQYRRGFRHRAFGVRRRRRGAGHALWGWPSLSNLICDRDLVAAAGLRTYPAVLCQPAVRWLRWPNEGTPFLPMRTGFVRVAGATRFALCRIWNRGLVISLSTIR